MTETDLRTLGQTRRLIFENVANGVPMEQVRVAFRRSQVEVDSDLRFVASKIREARFRTQMPPIACDEVAEIRLNRFALLETLRQLSDDYLASGLVIPKIGVQAIDSPGLLRDAAQHVHARTRGL